MTKEKNTPPPTDHEGNIYRKDYAPGVAHFLRELTDDAEKTFLQLIKEGAHQHRDFWRKLKVLLDANLAKRTAEVFGLPSLSALSFVAHREASTYPPVVSKETTGRGEAEVSGKEVSAP